MYGLETHLARMHKWIDDFAPQVVIVDPITNLCNVGTIEDSTNMLTRLLDFLHRKGITGLFISLTAGSQNEAVSEVSSMADAWLLLRDIELSGERNRALYVLKSRGMEHSNQVREFLITSKGVRLVPAYLGPAGVFTGSARINQEALDQAEIEHMAQESERRKLALEHRRQVVEAQIAALRAGYAAEEAEYQRAAGQEHRRTSALASQQLALARSRQVGPARNGKGES
jgi:circadian clock protein KaiC